MKRQKKRRKRKERRMRKKMNYPKVHGRNHPLSLRKRLEWALIRRPILFVMNVSIFFKLIFKNNYVYVHMYAQLEIHGLNCLT